MANDGILNASNCDIRTGDSPVVDVYAGIERVLNNPCLLGFSDSAFGLPALMTPTNMDALYREAVAEKSGISYAKLNSDAVAHYAKLRADEMARRDQNFEPDVRREVAAAPEYPKPGTVMRLTQSYVYAGAGTVTEEFLPKGTLGMVVDAHYRPHIKFEGHRSEWTLSDKLEILEVVFPPYSAKVPEKMNLIKWALKIVRGWI